MAFIIVSLFVVNGELLKFDLSVVCLFVRFLFLIFSKQHQIKIIDDYSLNKRPTNYFYFYAWIINDSSFNAIFFGCDSIHFNDCHSEWKSKWNHRLNEKSDWSLINFLYENFTNLKRVENIFCSSFFSSIFCSFFRGDKCKFFLWICAYIFVFFVFLKNIHFY